MTDVAFIGLGVMGLSMARNIIAAGHKVTGFDMSSEALDAHVANGGIRASLAAQAAQGAQFVLTMLPNGSIVRSALFAAGGALETIDSSATVIDMSTHLVYSEAQEQGRGTQDWTAVYDKIRRQFGVE